MDKRFGNQIEEIKYDNTVSLIFSLKGQYTIYDVSTGIEVFQMYKHRSVWLGEGYDTVNITLPDSVITYRYLHKEDRSYYHINEMENGQFTYTSNDGWKIEPEEKDSDVWGY